MSEVTQKATKTAATKAAQTAAKQAVHSAKNVETATELASKALVNSRDLRVAAVTLVGATLGLYAVNTGRAMYRARKLNQEIAAATAEDGTNGHRASRA